MKRLIKKYYCYDKCHAKRSWNGPVTDLERRNNAVDDGLRRLYIISMRFNYKCTYKCQVLPETRTKKIYFVLLTINCIFINLIPGPIKDL